MGWDRGTLTGNGCSPGGCITEILLDDRTVQTAWVLCAAAAAAKSLQSCLTLCDPIDSGPLDSPVPGILQARTLEWVAISFSNAWKWKVKVESLSCVQLLATPWTAPCQAPLLMGFSRQEYWSGVPLPSPGFSVGGEEKSQWCREDGSLCGAEGRARDLYHHMGALQCTGQIR